MLLAILYVLLGVIVSFVLWMLVDITKDDNNRALLGVASVISMFLTGYAVLRLLMLIFSKASQ